MLVTVGCMVQKMELSNVPAAEEAKPKHIINSYNKTARLGTGFLLIAVQGWMNSKFNSPIQICTRLDLN